LPLARQWVQRNRCPEPPGGTMSKRARKKKARKNSGANHGKRPNS